MVQNFKNARKSFRYFSNISGLIEFLKYYERITVAILKIDIAKELKVQ